MIPVFGDLKLEMLYFQGYACGAFMFGSNIENTFKESKTKHQSNLILGSLYQGPMIKFKLLCEKQLFLEYSYEIPHRLGRRTEHSL